MKPSGTCPACKGTGRGVRAPNPDGKASPFAALCARCQGSGVANLTPEERAAEFGRREWEGQQAAHQRVPPSPIRPGFRSGIGDADAIRQRRDEIRRDEKRTEPSASVAPVTESVTDAKCPCGGRVGECNGMCCGC